MKRCILLLIVLLFLSACNSESAEYEAPVNYYYIRNEVAFGTESGVMVKTVREAKGHLNDYSYLINEYLSGPTSYDCISPFPAGTTLEELHWDQNRIQIVLSPHIAMLSGSDLIVACSCLTQTVSDMTGINTVQIRAKEGLLNGEEVLTLTANSFICWDQYNPSDR